MAKVLVTLVCVLAIAGMASAATREQYYATLTTGDVRPQCIGGNIVAGKVTVTVTDASTGTFSYSFSVRKLTGTTTTLDLGVGFYDPNGEVIATVNLNGATRDGGTFTSPDLLTALRDDPHAVFANVNTSTCPGGEVGGQFNESGAKTK